MLSDFKQNYSNWMHNKAMKQVDKNPHLKLRVVCDDHRVYTKIVDETNDDEERYPVAGHKSNAAIFFKDHSDEFDMKKNDLDETELMTTNYLSTYMQQNAIKQAMPLKEEGKQKMMNYLMLAGIGLLVVMMAGMM